ncbi:MAG TPA: hypothetical protein VKT76_06770 [Bradyrhizobium sp.]|nr:hypothetical protein [Bradyrhizobium sp.]
MLLGMHAFPASAGNAEECVAAFQNNKERIAASGQTGNNFLINCLKASPSKSGAAQNRVIEGSVVAPSRPDSIPNTIGGVATMPRN